MDTSKLHFVKWETIASPMAAGGLGFLDFGDMSTTLAANWIFKYGNNKNTLWWKVVCERISGNYYNLLPVLENSGNNSVYSRFINSVVGSSRWARDVINQHFKILVGDGRDTDFWNDDWTGRWYYGFISQEFLRWLHLNLGRC